MGKARRRERGEFGEKLINVCGFQDQILEVVGHVVVLLDAGFLGQCSLDSWDASAPLRRV